MPRLTKTIMGAEEFYDKATAPMVDIAQLEAGQNGFQTDFRGYVSNSAYVKRNLIAVLIEAPKGFQDLPNPNHWIATLKSLIEVHAQSIEGLQSTLEVENAETPVGGAGEIQEDLSNVTRARSTPTFNWTEKYGKPIFSFLHGWITYLMMDPITKIPMVMTRAGITHPTDLLPDYNSCTVLFIEPDPTHKRVVHAWLSTNMRPKTSGEVVANRDLTTGGETVSYSVEFTALTQEGLGVRLMAQRYLDELNLTNVNPNLRPAFVEEIEADVLAAESGYSKQNDEAAETVVDLPQPQDQ